MTVCMQILHACTTQTLGSSVLLPYGRREGLSHHKIRLVKGTNNGIEHLLHIRVADCNVQSYRCSCSKPFAHVLQIKHVSSEDFCALRSFVAIPTICHEAWCVTLANDCKPLASA